MDLQKQDFVCVWRHTHCIYTYMYTPTCTYCLLPVPCSFLLLPWRQRCHTPTLSWGGPGLVRGPV